MAFFIRNKTAGAIVIPDLGFTIPAGATFEIDTEQPQDVANSTDLQAAISANATTGPGSTPGLVVIDPIDGTTELSVADSQAVALSHNDPHWGIRGADIDQLDDVDTTTSAPTTNDLLQWDGTNWVPVPPGTVAGNIDLDDLGDVDDPTAHTLNTIYVFQGDGTNLDVIDPIGNANFEEVIEDIIGAAFQNGTESTFVYNDVAGTMQVNVNDSFLKNTGDTLDSGTLDIAEGAALNISGDTGSGGATITIGQDATATIQTPTGGFTNDVDIINKAYVDSVANGIDWKESVRASTTPGGGDIGGTYAPAGGTGGSGAFTNVDLTSDALWDGAPTAVGPLAIGDRLLVKDQTDAKQNGIYVVTTAGATGAIERAEDQDGTPASEVSGGNTTFVENGTLNANTQWSVIWDGNVTLNTDPVNWTQIAGPGAIIAGIGLSRAGTQIDLDVNDLSTASIALGDSIAFHDLNGTPVSSGSQTRKTTLQTLLNDRDIPYGITTLGFIKRTAEDTYTTVSISSSPSNDRLGIEVVNGASTSTGDVQVGLNIEGLTNINADMAATDRFVVYDPDTDQNYYITGQDISDAITGGGAIMAYSTINGNTGSATAATNMDTLDIVGGTTGGIRTTGADGAGPPNDSITINLDISTLAAGTTVALTDEIAVDQGAAANVKFTFTDVVQDLNIVSGITANGIIVRTSDDNYASRSIAVAGVGRGDGLAVTNGDGVAGDPTLELDIDGTPAAGENIAATDEFVGMNASAATAAGANQKFTGQEVADGVADILNLNDLEIVDIDGESVLVITDTNRGNKKLSVSETPIVFSEQFVGNNDWISIGNAVSAEVGYIMPHDATIVKVTAHTSDDNNNSKTIRLYVDGVDTAAIVSFTAVNGENEYRNTSSTINYDVSRDQKIRLRGDAAGGSVNGLTVTLWVKWRDV